MNYLYIKELEKKEEILWLSKLPNCIKNLLWKIITKNNIIITKKIDENRIIWLVTNIKRKNAYKKIENKIKNKEMQKWRIVLSKRIKKEQWDWKKYRIVEGRDVFFNNLELVLKRILQEKSLALQDIYILTNQYIEQNINLIKDISNKVKSTNIITKEIGKYKKLEEAKQEEGIAFSVANNKRKSLKRAKIIINLDFTLEEINEYNIFRNSIIINLTQEKINLKGFEGITIQDIIIGLEKEEQEWVNRNNLKESFKQIEIYETMIEKSQKDNIHIYGLYGNNGEISQKELRNWQKILTNEKN